MLSVFHSMGLAAPGCVKHWLSMHLCVQVNTLRPRQNGRHFADDIFKRIFFNENVRISIKISLKFVPKGPINNIKALVQIMAWRRPGDKPLSEAMLVSLLTHKYVTRPQWVNGSQATFTDIYLHTFRTCFSDPVPINILKQHNKFQVLVVMNG